MARAKRTVVKRLAAKQSTTQDRVVATNRRARHDYELIETFECGIVLLGSEVKSLRTGRAQLNDSYARVSGGEVWLYGVHIPPWQYATGFGAHDPDRRRKLLLHRGQIDELLGKTQQQPLTLIPVKLYFRGCKAKIAVALARGRRLYDKRRVLAARDAEREPARAVRAPSHWVIQQERRSYASPGQTAL